MALAKNKKAAEDRDRAEKLALKPRLVWDEMSRADHSPGFTRLWGKPHNLPC